MQYLRLFFFLHHSFLFVTPHKARKGNSMYVLCLNDMRSSKIEILQDVARAETKEQLKAFVEKHKVEPYLTDERWSKVFKQDGILEWFNPPYDHQEEHHFRHITPIEKLLAEVTENIGTSYRKFLEEIPDVGKV